MTSNDQLTQITAAFLNAASWHYNADTTPRWDAHAHQQARQYLAPIVAATRHSLGWDQYPELLAERLWNEQPQWRVTATSDGTLTLQPRTRAGRPPTHDASRRVLARPRAGQFADQSVGRAAYSGAHG